MWIQHLRRTEAVREEHGRFDRGKEKSLPEAFRNDDMYFFRAVTEGESEIG